MHALTRNKEALEKLWGKFIELCVNTVAHELEYLFDLLNVDDLLGGTCNRPEFKKALNQWNMKLC